MSNIDLELYGIYGTKEIVYNPSYELLYEEEMKKQQAGGQAGAGPDPNAGASDSNASGGNSNPGDDVVDGDFKEV